MSSQSDDDFSDEQEEDVGDAFNSKSLGLRAQKKLLGKMASKKIAKAFIDETSGRLLDNLYWIAREHSGSKKAAEKVLKHMIKSVIKIGILYRNDQFNSDELQIAENFKKKFRGMAMTFISFYEVDFTFDKNFMSKTLNECGALLKQLVQRHLTDKSLCRIDHVFLFFSNTDLLECIFNKRDSRYRDRVTQMVEDLNILLENGTL